MRRLPNGSYVIAKLDGQRKLLMQVCESLVPIGIGMCQRVVCVCLFRCIWSTQSMFMHINSQCPCKEHANPQTQGAGASPEGNRPFLSVLDLDRGTRSEIWRSQPPHLEALGSILSDTNDAPITLDVRISFAA